MALHLIFSIRGFQACHPRTAAGDTLVLLGDGVYCREQAGSPQFAQLQVHCLEEDLTVRGLPVNSDNNLDYAGLVQLCTQSNPVVSWND